MPRTFGKKKREQQAAPAPVPERRGELTSMLGANAPIYKAQGGNKFDKFIKERDEEGIVADMHTFGLENVREMNPEIAILSGNAIGQKALSEKLKQWGERWNSTQNATRTVNWEPLMKQPVFETHAKKNVFAPHSHSFIALRFTMVNDNLDLSRDSDAEVAKQTFSRVRLAVGYGHGSTTMGKNTGNVEGGGGCLINDKDTEATAHTETPIDNVRARVLLQAVPKFHAKFNYNGLLANCNDFALTMSKLVGAKAPAMLHDHGTPNPSAKDIEKHTGQRLEGDTTVSGKIKGKIYGEPFSEADLSPMIFKVKNDMEWAINKDGGMDKVLGISTAFLELTGHLYEVNEKSKFRDELYAPAGARENPDEKERRGIGRMEDLIDQYEEIIVEAKRLLTASANAKHTHVDQIIWNLIETMKAHIQCVSGKIDGVRRRRTSRLISEKSRREEAAAAQVSVPVPPPAPTPAPAA